MSSAYKLSKELAVFGYVKLHYNSNIFPNELMLVIATYLISLIDSKILKEDETDLFEQLLQENSKNELLDKQWNLLYHAKINGFERESFVNKCHDKRNLLCFIQTDSGNVFGGYTSAGWKVELHKRDTYLRDTKTFIFLIRSSKNYKPKIFNVRPDKVDKAIRNYGSPFYCFFGTNEIHLRSKTREGWNYNASVYESYPSSHYLNAGVNSFKCTDFEIFQLS
eukprot:340361_1